MKIPNCHPFRLGLAVCATFLVSAAPLLAQQAGTVTGQVTHATSGRELSGVQVSIVGSGLGTLTGNNGRFLIPNVPAGPVTVRADMIGFGVEEVQVTVDAGGTALADFALTERAISLDEIVVTGSGAETARRKLGNSISTVNAVDVVRSAPITSVDQLIQGRSAGVAMNLASGTVGLGGMIRIRGMTSVSLSGDPVVYIDGIRVDASHDQSGVWFGGMDISRLQDISPSEIDRIEIVKGSAASTLYGTQGANGVIQIFTKRGRSGAPQWNFEVEQGFERTPTDTFPGRMNQYFQGPDGFQARDPTELVENGYHHRYAGSVSGGGQAVRYFISGSYKGQEASLKGDANWNKVITGRLNLTTVLSPTVTVTATTGIVHNRLRVPDDNNALHGLYSQFASGLPYTASPERPYGERFGSVAANSTLENFQRVLRTTSGFEVTHQPTDNFSHTFRSGVDWYADEFTKFFPFGYEGSGNKLGNKRNHTRSFRDITTEYRATLSNSFGETLTSEFTAGFQGNFENTIRVDARGTDFPAPGVKSVDATSTTQGSERRVEEINAGVFVQETLGLWDKVFVTAGMRLDGNSAFGNEFNTQLYPKASVAYNISQEGFWPAGLVPTMKLRVAYGESGLAPAQFAADRTWAPVSAQGGLPAVTPGNIGNPELGPERSREVEVGMDAGLLDDRIGLEFTAYFQKTRDALLFKPFPSSQGFTADQLTNIGQIENRGIEIGLNALLYSSESLELSSNVQFATSKNEVTDMGGVADISGFGYRISEGYPVHGAWGYELVGWDPTARRHSRTDEQMFQGQTDPKWFGSYSTQLRWGNLTLDGMAEFRGGMVKNNFSRYWSNRVRTGDEYLSLVQRPNGDPTPASDSLYNYTVTLGWTGFYEPADFFTVRELSVGYDLPDELLSQFGLTRSSIRFSARNLWMWSKFSGIHPETNWDGAANLRQAQDFDTLPPPRIFLLTFRTSM
ncbi:MAG: TonB-dependent receptor plug domain-containing protein [Gemmatimonadetes bacterium]|nr:TonB-dependent receptor plug domain-containing protein [Gemmatimonadota bacterium]MYC90761.1 TonB-dependent receptor plug domain-containing protein [Gemmatimonadota bacterium]MYG35553.1 TonB-dependent receptor plug domain-containing protein [Gemmatimonadota bacterium]MYJ18921.1 TonB-dependent receptor plug domain-containing protein [Gemmatimonadota bacterium]